MNIHLSSVAGDRDNNFNLLRFSAATGVFISHTFILSGTGFKSAAAVLGFISVNVFFIISGFLVTKSLLDRGSLKKFALARVLRIYPALILAVLFSTFIVGIAFTELPIKEYLLNPNTYEYVYKNIFLVFPDIPETLPGVFVNTSSSTIVNAPLWTLPYEIKMYILLGIVGSLFLFLPENKYRSLFNLFFILITLISMGFFVAGYTVRGEPVNFGFSYDYFRLIAMFGSGVLLFMLRDSVYLSTKYFVLIIVVIAASSFFRPIFVALTYSSLCYLVIYLAYFPNGLIRQFNKLGDYSYGIYIYGYPIQQSVENLWPNLHLLEYFILTYIATLILSVLSWHLIEKRMLRFKNRTSCCKIIS
jgi:peptidoglycan/LPS O-acetylase OafA/YrhL